MTTKKNGPTNDKHEAKAERAPARPHARSSHSTAHDVIEVDANPLATDESVVAIEGSVLTTRDEAFLNRVAKFLVGIQSQRFAPRARQVNYTADEHKLGWKLWRVASGEERPLDHWLETSLHQNVDPGSVAQTHLVDLDTFENLWFPRTRAIIRRVVATGLRDAFAEGFFKDLAQQPLGPGVIGSVATFLDRVEALATSKAPHATDVHKTLAERGLTAAKVGKMRGLINELQAEYHPTQGPTTKPSAAEIAAAEKAQLAALAELHDWFTDWATMLRGVFSPRDQIKLGLTVIKRAAAQVEPPAPAPAGVSPA